MLNILNLLYIRYFISNMLVILHLILLAKDMTIFFNLQLCECKRFHYLRFN